MQVRIQRIVEAVRAAIARSNAAVAEGRRLVRQARA